MLVPGIDGETVKIGVVFVIHVSQNTAYKSTSIEMIENAEKTGICRIQAAAFYIEMLELMVQPEL
ncbi:MAG: hypothetical protein QG657_5520, partial [Acidobacteriota bacterium]|nr:hypothetical protein [Acidobacteriota bacterium]